MRLMTLMRLTPVVWVMLLVGQMAIGGEQLVSSHGFAVTPQQELKLDLHRAGEQTGPLVVWVHGGAWRAGTREECPIKPLVERGYVIASVDYRLSPVAKFPAQVHDIKAAIRFLRGHQERLGIDASRIVIAGSSAGGHLAALMGVTNGVASLEGVVGDDHAQSSDVQAIIDYYGPTNFHTILEQSTPHGLSVRVPAFELLLGGLPKEQPELAKLASPVEHVDSTDPPLLLIHGELDPQVPIEQAVELKAAYEQAGLKVEYVVIPGGKHGGEEFYDDERLGVVDRFLRGFKPRMNTD